MLSLDPQVGDFEKADVLIEGKKISAVGPNLWPPRGLQWSSTRRTAS